MIKLEEEEKYDDVIINYKSTIIDV